jgi:hypothetical protein
MLSKESRKKEAMHHKDILGDGAKKRKSLPAKEKVGVVMSEFKNNTLHSGSGKKVTNPKQAIAIGLSEARKAGAKIKPKGEHMAHHKKEHEHHKKEMHHKKEKHHETKKEMMHEKKKEHHKK